MPAPDANVLPLPTLLERIALRAAQAMTEHHSRRNGAIRAVLTYGEALLEGRKLHTNNETFSRWVSANCLDIGKPWNTYSERHAAMRLATLILRNSPEDAAFNDCTVSRPVDIMKWYRATVQGIAPKPRPRASAETSRANKAIAEMAAEGLRISGPSVAERAGVGETTALKAVNVYRQTAARSPASPAPPPPDAPVSLAGLTEKSKVTLAKAIEAERARLRRAHAATVETEVRRIITSTDDHIRNRLKEAEVELEGYRRMFRQKGIFTRLEFRQLQMCVHPDNKLSASDDVRNRIFDILMRNEVRLLKEI